MAFDFVAGYVLGARQGGKAAGLAASAASFSSSSATARTEDLVARVDRLTLVVQAMWSMLEEDGRTEEELLERINALDLEDGNEDGVRVPPPRVCENCNAKVAAALSTCQFCGSDMGSADVFSR